MHHSLQWKILWWAIPQISAFVGNLSNLYLSNLNDKISKYLHSVSVRFLGLLIVKKWLLSEADPVAGEGGGPGEGQKYEIYVAKFSIHLFLWLIFTGPSGLWPLGLSCLSYPLRFKATFAECMFCSRLRVSNIRGLIWIQLSTNLPFFKNSFNRIFTC